MDKKGILLAALAAAGGVYYTPVQIQKLMFLIDENIGNLIEGKKFNFKPYDYGPFDKAVYEELESLSSDGLVEIIPQKTWLIYQLSPHAQEIANENLNSLSKEAKNYVIRASEFVRRLSFNELVKAIYNAYPEMKKNSVFQG